MRDERLVLFAKTICGVFCFRFELLFLLDRFFELCYHIRSFDVESVKIAFAVYLHWYSEMSNEMFEFRITGNRPNA